MSKLLIVVVLFVVLGIACAYEIVHYVPTPVGPPRVNRATGHGQLYPPVTFTAPASYNGQPFAYWHYKCWGGDTIGHGSRGLTITIPHKDCDCMGGYWSYGAGAWAYYGSGSSMTALAAQMPER